MKKITLPLLMLLTAILTFVSCSDDPEVIVPPTPESIAGTYSIEKLNLELKVNGQYLPHESGASIVVSVVSDQVVKVTLNNIIEGVASYEMTDVSFSVDPQDNEADLAGTAIDNAVLYKIAFKADIDEEVMEAEVILQAITVETYSVDKLKLTLNGAPQSTAGKVHFITEEGGTFVKLESIIKESNTYVIPVTSQVKTKTYVKEFAGEKIVTDEGFSILVKGNVEGEVMEIAVDEVSLEAANASVFYNKMFTGDMLIKVPQMGEFSLQQHIYASKPSNELDEYIQLVIRNFSFGDMPLGDIVLDTIKCLRSGDKIIFSEKGRTLDVGLMTGLKIDFDGFFQDDQLTIHLDVDAQGLLVSVDFSSTQITNTIQLSYTFGNEWVKPNPEAVYYDPAGLCSSNPAVVLLQAFGKVPSGSLAVEKDGDAAKINTWDSQGLYMPFAIIPKITAGTLFNGTFEVDLSNTLKSTRFGEIFEGRPEIFSFEYRYEPGAVYYKTVIGEESVTGQEMPDMKDACSLAAVLYEVSNAAETLTGVDLYTSPKVIAVAQKTDDVKSAAFLKGSVPFQYIGTYDPAKLYKLAVVCSSSSKGDSFEGAPGSALWVKKLEITATK